VPDVSTVVFLAVVAVVLFLAGARMYRRWRAFREGESAARISFPSFVGTALALGLGAKFAIAVFLLVVQIPLQRATSYLTGKGILHSDIAAIVGYGLPLVALFLIINALNALPEREKDK
jgi:hypothetical protein